MTSLSITDNDIAALTTYPFLFFTGYTNKLPHLLRHEIKAISQMFKLQFYVQFSSTCCCLFDVFLLLLLLLTCFIWETRTNCVFTAKSFQFIASGWFYASHSPYYIYILMSEERIGLYHHLLLILLLLLLPLSTPPCSDCESGAPTLIYTLQSHIFISLAAI